MSEKSPIFYPATFGSEVREVNLGVLPRKLLLWLFLHHLRQSVEASGSDEAEFHDGMVRRTRGVLHRRGLGDIEIYEEVSLRRDREVPVAVIAAQFEQVL
jgi:hypothetical protein